MHFQSGSEPFVGTVGLLSKRAHKVFTNRPHMPPIRPIQSTDARESNITSRAGQIRGMFRARGESIDHAKAETMAAFTLMADRAGVGVEELLVLLAKPERAARDYLRAHRNAPGRRAERPDHVHRPGIVGR